MGYSQIAAMIVALGHKQIIKKPKFKHVIAFVVRDGLEVQS